MRHHLARSEKVQSKIDRNRKRMLDFARGLEEDHAITLVPQLAALVRTREVTEVRLDNLVHSLDPIAAQAVRSDQRFRGIKFCTAQLRRADLKLAAIAAGAELEQLSRSELDIEAVRESLRVEIKAALAELSGCKLSVKRTAVALGPWVRRAFDLADKGRKVSAILSDGAYGEEILHALRSLGKLH